MIIYHLFRISVTAIVNCKNTSRHGRSSQQLLSLFNM